MAEKSGPIELDVRVPEGETLGEKHVTNALTDPKFIKKLTGAVATDGATIHASTKKELGAKDGEPH